MDPCATLHIPNHSLTIDEPSPVCITPPSPPHPAYLPHTHTPLTHYQPASSSALALQLTNLPSSIPHPPSFPHTHQHSLALSFHALSFHALSLTLRHSSAPPPAHPIAYLQPTSPFSLSLSRTAHHSKAPASSSQICPHPPPLPTSILSASKFCTMKQIRQSVMASCRDKATYNSRSGLRAEEGLILAYRSSADHDRHRVAALGQPTLRNVLTYLMIALL